MQPGILTVKAKNLEALVNHANKKDLESQRKDELDNQREIWDQVFVIPNNPANPFAGDVMDLVNLVENWVDFIARVESLAAPDSCLRVDMNAADFLARANSFFGKSFPSQDKLIDVLKVLCSGSFSFLHQLNETEKAIEELTIQKAENERVSKERDKEQKKSRLENDEIKLNQEANDYADLILSKDRFFCTIDHRILFPLADETMRIASLFEGDSDKITKDGRIGIINETTFYIDNTIRKITRDNLIGNFKIHSKNKAHLDEGLAGIKRLHSRLITNELKALNNNRILGTHRHPHLPLGRIIASALMLLTIVPAIVKFLATGSPIFNLKTKAQQNINKLTSAAMKINPTL